MTDTEQLKATRGATSDEARRAKNVLHSAIAARRDEIARLLDIEKARIAAEMDAKYGATIDAATSAAHEASVAAEAAAIAYGHARLAELHQGLWERWEHPGKGWGYIISAPKRVVATGRLEVWTSASVYPENTSSRPNAGAVVMRIMKKDGKPSTKVANPFNLSEQISSGWKPAKEPVP